MKGTGQQLILCVLAVQASLQGAQNFTSMVRLLPPTNQIEAARSHYPLGDFGRIASNTPAFEEYALRLMLLEANKLREEWNLDIPKPLTLGEVLFQLKPTVFGIDGAIGTRDGRYSWSFDRNALSLFSDNRHRPISFRYNDHESARLAKIRSLIGMMEAEQIAKDALHKLGITEKQLLLKERPDVNQYNFQETDGIVYPLPVFHVTWRSAGPKQFAAEDLECEPFTIVISGITKKVVEYSTTEAIRINSPLERWPIPTNYFQMLGLPTNYLETIPERKRAVWGLPPLSNSPAASSRHSSSNMPPGTTPPPADRKSAF